MAAFANSSHWKSQREKEGVKSEVGEKGVAELLIYERETAMEERKEGGMMWGSKLVGSLILLFDCY